tara:strand:+ start:402 stop:1565 length:1164 start_codon:yes stop_codon:yes gene_type:complete
MSITDALLSGNTPDPKLTRKFFSLRKEIEDQFDKNELKEYKKIGSVNKCPDIPNFDEIKHRLDTKVAVVATINVAMADVDRSYDREINWHNIKEFIKKEKGFNYDACGIIDVVYDLKRNRFIVVIGQHRVIMNTLCLGFLSTIPAKITLLDESLSEHDQIKIEAEKHNSEANNTTAQKPHERGLSAYIAGDKEVTKYVDFCVARNIGVKGTEHLFPNMNFTKVCETAWAVGRAMKVNTSNAGEGLILLRDYLDGNKIDGKSISAITQYLTYFGELLESTAKENAMTKDTFVRNVFNYAFNTCGNSTEDWLDGTSMFRGEATMIPLARLVKLTNQYCKVHKLKLSDGRKSTNKSKWINPNDKVWVKFLNKTKTPDILRSIPNSIISQI